MVLELESDLEWLPERAGWALSLDEACAFALKQTWQPGLAEALERFRRLASSRMDFARTMKLDRAVQRHLERVAAGSAQAAAGMTCIKLALLGSSTVTHLIPGIRVAALRRNLPIEVYEAPYGTYRQELADTASGLHRFQPTVVLLALDARHLAAMGTAAQALDAMRRCWRMAQQAWPCAVMQQAVLPVFAPLLGNGEERLAASPASLVEELNAALRFAAEEAGVTVLALDRFSREEGIHRWHDAGLWHRAKQEVHPAMSPVYGEQVARVVAAGLGQSAKCLVLDLDNTLWGGVLGDDGVDGIALGQGSPEGEAYLEFQRYARGLMERGVILAVCSKNDEANALAAFERHPAMVLRREHIACFVANWDDKPANLRRIARELRIGLDSLVFVDDNPAERGLVRRELPMVAVPEMPPDPADYIRVLAAAGYFEGLGVTREDHERAAQYAANAHRQAGLAALAEDGTAPATDLASYLAGLHMELHWKPFDAAGRARTLQLINKTNQFNLTTRRCVEAEVEELESLACGLTMQVRLKDIYGDSGMVAVVAGRFAGGTLSIEHWLMSCRVLGRQVEDAIMNLVVEQACARGARHIVGRYVPTAKNAMVRDFYSRMSFTPLETAEDGTTLWDLDLPSYEPRPTQIACFALDTTAAR